MAVDEKDNGPVRVVDRRWWARSAEETAEQQNEAARKPTVVEDLEQQLADARGRLQEVLTEHRRSIDEFEQVKLRIRRDVARDVERGRRAILVDLLDVVDNLERAIDAARKGAQATDASAAIDGLVRGVELVRDSFLSKLQGLGVTRVATLGQVFDAARHEAVTTTPVSDPAQDGTVVAVVKDGYAIGDDILRPASVVVGQYAR